MFRKPVVDLLEPDWITLKTRSEYFLKDIGASIKSVFEILVKAGRLS